MLKSRVLTALVLIPVTLWALFALPSRGWAVFTLIVILIAAGEWAHLAGFGKVAGRSFVLATLLIAGGLAFAPDLAANVQTAATLGWITDAVPIICGAATLFWVLGAPAWLASGRRVESPFLFAATGWLVLFGLWVAVIALQARSPKLLLAFMAIVWIADTAAYFAGRRFGRHKLAPAISPGKTWEGVYGALAATALYALGLALWAPHWLSEASRGVPGASGPPAALAAAQTAMPGSAAPIVVVAAIILVVLLAVISIVGDLFESQLKRQRGVKDSGHVLPGHGGVLDRIDALTAAMPPAALIAHYLIR